jgi:hypothetical protein
MGHRGEKPTTNRLSYDMAITYLTCTTYRIFNGLPSDIKGLMNEKAQFKIALKRYLNTLTFYSVDEYLLCRK